MEDGRYAGSRGYVMRDRTRRLLGLCLLAEAAFISYVKSRPLPVEDVDTAEGLEARLWSFVTPDGLILRGKRYYVPGGQPIILAHCFAGNGFEFDIPKKGYNLAVYLARRGFDVYMYNARGCGREPFISDPGDWLHSLDHFAALDAPTLVEGVRRETGMKPAWLGHSMGGAILYMYLQGISVRSDGVGFEADPTLAAERNEAITAGVAMAAPLSFTWPEGAPYGRIMRSGPARFVLDRASKFLRGLPTKRQKISAIRYSAILADMLPRLTSVLMKNPALGMAYNPRNVDGGVMTLMARIMLDNTSVRMSVQFLDDMREGDSRDYCRDYSYTAHMDRITVPMLFVTGSKDFLSAEEVRRCCFEPAASRVKDYLCFEGFGHLDLVLGLDVETIVYPRIAEWLEGVTGGSH